MAIGIKSGTRRRRKRWTSALAALALVAAASPGAARAQDAPGGETSDRSPRADWTLALEEDGISVFTRRAEGSKRVAFRGVVTLPASVEDVEAVLSDIDGYPDWYARCTWATTVERQPPDWRIVHMKIDLPFPAGDRDAVVRVDREPGAQRLVLRMRALPEHLPASDGFVRMPRVDGSWTLEALPQGGTRVTLEQLNDPGGSLPAWLTNMLVTDQPLQTLSGLREVLAGRG